MKTLLLILFPFLLTAHDPWAYYRSDDFKHYQAGIMINGAACSSVYFFTGNHKKALFWGNAVSLTATIGKEVVYDLYLKRGTPSVGDAANGLLGTVLKSFVFVVYIDRKHKRTVKIDSLKYQFKVIN